MVRADSLCSKTFCLNGCAALLRCLNNHQIQCWEKQVQVINRSRQQNINRNQFKPSTSVQMMTLSSLHSVPRLTQASSWEPMKPTAWRWMLSSGTTSIQRFSSLAVQTGPSRSGTIPSSKMEVKTDDDSKYCMTIFYSCALWLYIWMCKYSSWLEDNEKSVVADTMWLFY